MKSTYGNIEAMRTMLILNEILPSLNGNFKLGELKVLGISQSEYICSRLFVKYY